MDKKNLTEIWDLILEDILKEEENKDSIELILENTKLREIDEKSGKAVVVSETEVFKTIIDTNWYNQIKESINLRLNSNFQLVILTEDEYQKYLEDQKKSEFSREIDLNSYIHPNDSLNPNYLFSNFISSESNKSLFASAMIVAQNPGRKFNPLFIYGGSGLGKTHLLHAIGNEAWRRIPSMSIKYIESRDFGKTVGEVMKNKGDVTSQIAAFQEKFSKYDILLVDDIQFIESWDKTKEIFFNIFNYFITQGKQVVLTADRYPEEMDSFEDRFRTRFKSGLVITVVPPDIDTAIKIIKLKLTAHVDFDLKQITEEALEYIATNFSSNIRDIEGAINRIILMNIVEGASLIDLNRAHVIFKEITKNKHVSSPKRIINEVAKHFKVAAAEITGTNRRKEIMFPRHIAIYLCKTMLGISLKEIGREFNRDHSTIISSIEKIEKEKETNTEIAQVIYDLRKLISSN